MVVKQTGMLPQAGSHVEAIHSWRGAELSQGRSKDRRTFCRRAGPLRAGSIQLLPSAATSRSGRDRYIEGPCQCRGTVQLVVARRGYCTTLAKSTKCRPRSAVARDGTFYSGHRGTDAHPH